MVALTDTPFAVMVLLLEAARHPGEPDWMKPGR